MKKETYPRGWDEARVRRVLEHYESQSDEESATEIEAGLESTTMQVPVSLVPAVRRLIAERRASRADRRGKVRSSASSAGTTGREAARRRGPAKH